MDITAFIRARLVEWEAVAETTGGRGWRTDHDGCCVLSDAEGVVFETTGRVDTFREPDVRHAARHDPASVLAEVETLRRIVDECSGDEPGSDYYLRFPDVTDGLNMRVLQALASIWRDHPQYDPAWAPEEART